MIIRAVAQDDWDQWRDLWTGYLAFYETELADEVFETSFARLLSEELDQYRGLVAEREGALIGLAHYLIHRDLWSLHDTCYLSDLFVDPMARKSGAARALLIEVEQRAKAAGAATLYWMTQDTNTTARTLYDQVADLMPFVQYSKSL